MTFPVFGMANAMMDVGGWMTSSICDHDGWGVATEQASCMLVAAARMGWEDHCRALLQAGADVAWGNHVALHTASINGHIHVVRMLLHSGADPMSCCCRALQYACLQKHIAVVDLLWDLSDPELALWDMHSHGWSIVDMAELVQRAMAVECRQQLTATLNTPPHSCMGRRVL